MFRTESKDVHESGEYTTNGVDMVVTSERVILLDTQVKMAGSLNELLMYLSTCSRS